MTPASDLQGVLAVQPHPGHPRQHPETGEPGAPGDLGQPGGEDRVVTTELVDEVTGQQGTVGVVEQPPSAVDRGEHPATVDVSHEHHRKVLLPGQTHVRVVPGAQVDLGGRPGTFTDDEIVCRGELVVGRPGRLGKGLPPGGVLAGLQHSAGLATQHDERAPVGAGLEQHRVHRRAGLHPGSSGLQVLCPTDLRAVGAHHGVVAHVLCLERHDVDPLTHCRTTQGGDDERLAGIRGGSGDEDSGHGCLLPARWVDRGTLLRGARAVILRYERAVRCAGRDATDRGTTPPWNSTWARLANPPTTVRVAVPVTRFTRRAASCTAAASGNGPDPSSGRNSTRLP